MISLDHYIDENLERDLQGLPEYLMPKNFEPSELGKKLYGFKKWDDKKKRYWAILGYVFHA